jgi:hypothetical protein
MRGTKKAKRTGHCLGSNLALSPSSMPNRGFQSSIGDGIDDGNAQMAVMSGRVRRETGKR